MSRDKHIEEMAKGIYENTDLSVVEIAENVAEYLYENGYRKASDVARDVIMDVIEILNDEYVKCNKWEAHIILAITQKIADLKKKYEKKG